MLNIYSRKSLYHYCFKYCVNKHEIDNFQFSSIFLPNPHFSPQNQALRTEYGFQGLPHDNIWCLENVAPQNIYVAISLMFGPKTGYFDWPIFTISMLGQDQMPFSFSHSSDNGFLGFSP